MTNKPKIRFAGYTDEWEQRKLGKITTYRNGTGHEEKQSESGKYELINLNSISIDGGLKPSGKFIDEETETLLKDDLVMVLSDVGHGDLLGRVALIPENNRFVLNQRVALLRNNGSVDIQYLFSYINAHQTYFKKQGAGSSQLNISRGSVENFNILLPHKDEQKNIGQFFSKIDSFITLHQRKLDFLKQCKKYMLSKMFPKDGETVPEIRFEGFTGDWEQRKLEELSDFITKGATPTTYGFEWQSSGIPFFRNDAIKDNQFIYGDYSYISEEANETLKRSEIHFNDILIAITGDIGKVGIVPKTIEKGNINQHTARVRIIKDAIPYFIYQSLATESKQMEYQLIKTGLSMPQLSLKQIRDTVVLCPSMNEQKKIGAYFSNLDTFITLHQRKLDSLIQFKKYMLQNMFPSAD